MPDDHRAAWNKFLADKLLREEKRAAQARHLTLSLEDHARARVCILARARLSHAREPATAPPTPSPASQALSTANAALAAKEIQRKQAVLKANKQHAVDAKRAAEDLASSSSSDEHASPHRGDGEAALSHLKTVAAVQDAQLKAEQLKLQTSAAELETAKLALQAARAAKEATATIIEEALEDDKTVLPPEATAKLISRTRTMQVTGFPATTEILDVPKFRHALKSVEGSEGGLATLEAPVHNGIWQRLGKGNYNPGRLTPKEATGSEKLHSLQAYLPASKNRKKGQGTPHPATLTRPHSGKPALTPPRGGRTQAPCRWTRGRSQCTSLPQWRGSSSPQGCSSQQPSSPA